MANPSTKNRVRLLIGPAGSGKTYTCLQEIRAALHADPLGAPLVLLTPKQATFQMERQLLEDEELQGYSRLQILSFDRLANTILSYKGGHHKELLSEEGRIMVLRALLSQHQSELRIFHASAGLPGLAEELSKVIREFQQHRLGIKKIQALSEKSHYPLPLQNKLHDIALLFKGYTEWLEEKNLADTDQLLDQAATAVEEITTLGLSGAGKNFYFDSLWMDGFAVLTPQERRLIQLIAQVCKKTTLAFCLEHWPDWDTDSTWSLWLPLQKTLHQCTHLFSNKDRFELENVWLRRDAAQSRFSKSEELLHLEKHWNHPRPFAAISSKDRNPGPGHSQQLELGIEEPEKTIPTIRITQCLTQEDETLFVAREILRISRERQIRFNEMAVMVRSLTPYQDFLRSAFYRYEIPIFIDQRESVAHHPFVELIRAIIRLSAYRWMNEDWFTLLKTGLLKVTPEEVDSLENAALEFGWKGTQWLNPLRGPEKVLEMFEPIRKGLLEQIQDFLNVTGSLGAHKRSIVLNGPTLGLALRKLWKGLGIQGQLKEWDEWESQHAKNQDNQRLHDRIFNEVDHWLSHLERAFTGTPLPVSKWIPIVEAGLNHLSVGVVPPALDQVMVGAIDRSRNPNIKATFLLGFNESVFPIRNTSHVLMSEEELGSLSEDQIDFGLSVRETLASERFLAYIACTRASDFLSITHAEFDAEGRSLSPSYLISHIQRLFPNLIEETFTVDDIITQPSHFRELLLSSSFISRLQENPKNWELGDFFEETSSLIKQLSRFNRQNIAPGNLDPDVAKALYLKGGEENVFKTSVSRLETFAECPFRFFVRTGLNVDERESFVVDPRRLGSFQHEILEAFHNQIKESGLTWHSITQEKAIAMIGELTESHMHQYHFGLMNSDPTYRVRARALGHVLSQFISTIISWMEHYDFEPENVEVSFGSHGAMLPPWSLKIPNGPQIIFSGIIDRVDLHPLANGSHLAIVIDYKSGLKKPDEILWWNGIQLQLATYLNVLNQETSNAFFQSKKLIPSGAFFTSLKSQVGTMKNRIEAFDLNGEEDGAGKTYQHLGCFDISYLEFMDTRVDQKVGDQFHYKLKKDGTPYKGQWHVMAPLAFEHFLQQTEEKVLEFGQRIFDGDLSVTPYKLNKKSACDYCQYATICRIDPWSHEFRALTKPH